MADATYMGIPRKEIPWYPTINEDLCTRCNACMDFCSNDVFAQGEITTIIANPYNCVVGCSSCSTECTAEAISFPSKKDLVKMLQELRQKYKSKV